MKALASRMQTKKARASFAFSTVLSAVARQSLLPHAEPTERANPRYWAGRLSQEKHNA